MKNSSVSRIVARDSALDLGSHTMKGIRFSRITRRSSILVAVNILSPRYLNGFSPSHLVSTSIRTLILLKVLTLHLQRSVMEFEMSEHT